MSLNTITSIPNKFAFIIPTYNHGLEKLIQEIERLFSDSQYYLIIIDDGSKKKIKPLKNAIIIRHVTNMGLAKSLLEGYKKSLELPVDLIIRIDADGEYPLYPVRKIINELMPLPEVAGSFIELKRDIKSNGIIDAAFHRIMGFIEGYFIFGFPLFQHSPGLQIYKKNKIEIIIPTLEKIVRDHKLRWGLDLAVIKLVSHQGKVQPFTLTSHSWVERRSIKKIFSQFISTVKVLNLLKNYN